MRLLFILSVLVMDWSQGLNVGGGGGAAGTCCWCWRVAAGLRMFVPGCPCMDGAFRR